MMDQNASYPEPDAGPEAMHPYANHQYPMPPSGHSHIPHAVEATMGRHSNGSGSFMQGTGHVAVHAQPATPQQLAQRSLDVNQQSDQNPDPSSRKRTKVSRACDECRRKKIRCDAESETPGTTCSSCRRAGTTCEFSRAPQKRGPSKGYIKELAERVGNLEYRTGAAPTEPQYHPLAPEQSGPYMPTNDLIARKRFYDSSGGPGFYDSAYNSHSDLTPRHERTHQDTSTREEPNIGVLQLSAHAQPQSNIMNATEVHKDLVNKYYELIHPTLPLLPRTTPLIQKNVQQVPAGVCDAFFAALEAAITACTNPNTEKSIKSAADQLKVIQANGHYTDTVLSKLVNLEALILMVIATENTGPSYDQKSVWISLAVDAATTMKLHHPPRLNDPNDLDSYTRGDLGRRAWLILFILDRWHAMGESDMLRVAEDSCKLVDHDRVLMSEGPYHLFRLSRIMGHLSRGFVFHSDELVAPPSKGGLLNEAIEGELELFRESVHQDFAKMPSIHLAYLHVKNVADRYLNVYAMNTGAVVDGAFRIVALLRHTKGIYCAPWIHHIIMLAARTLEQVADLELHPDAIAALHDLRDDLDTSLFRFHKEKTAWDIAISAMIAKKLNGGSQAFGTEGAVDRGGLGQLADAAVGKTDASNGVGTSGTSHGIGTSTSPKWSLLTTRGYLTTLE